MNDLSLYANPRTFEEWSAGFHARMMFRDELRWEIGDYLLIGDAKFSEKIWQVMDWTRYSEGDIRNMMSASRKFPKGERLDMPWSWHTALAALPKPKRDEIIGQIQAKQVTTREQIRLLAHQNGKVTELVDTPPLVDALLLVGRLLSRRAKGENVDEPLHLALVDLMAESEAELARICGKSDRGGLVP